MIKLKKLRDISKTFHKYSSVSKSSEIHLLHLSLSSFSTPDLTGVCVQMWECYIVEEYIQCGVECYLFNYSMFLGKVSAFHSLWLLTGLQ